MSGIISTWNSGNFYRKQPTFTAGSQQTILPSFKRGMMAVLAYALPKKFNKRRTNALAQIRTRWYVKKLHWPSLAKPCDTSSLSLARQDVSLSLRKRWKKEKRKKGKKKKKIWEKVFASSWEMHKKADSQGWCRLDVIHWTKIWCFTDNSA